MDTILVTGGAGYIGSHTCKELARQGYNPIVFDDFSTGHRESVRYGPLVEGNLADTDLLVDTVLKFKPDAVMHFAASAYVGESMQDPQKYFRNNVAATVSLLDALQTTRVASFIFSSTCATYGIPASIPIDEETTQHPVNPYGESKLFIERMLKWNSAAWSLKYVSLRYFNAAGAHRDGSLGEIHDPEPHLIPLAIATALGERSKLDIYGTDYPTSDGTAVRDYTHVEDLARAHIAALEYVRETGSSGAFNLGTGRGISVREVIDCIQKVSGCVVTIEEQPRRPGDPPVLVANPQRAQRLLNWRAECSDLQTIVETAFRWHTSRRSPS